MTISALRLTTLRSRSVRFRLRTALAGLACLSAAGAAPGLAQTSDAASAGFGSASHFVQKDGESLFHAICQGCHMPDGKGAKGAGTYPALAGNPNLEIAGYPVTLVLHGHNAMPGFADFLNDDQVAAVVNYVRTHLGNAYPDTVTAPEVKAAR